MDKSKRTSREKRTIVNIPIELPESRFEELILGQSDEDIPQVVTAQGSPSVASMARLLSQRVTRYGLEQVVEALEEQADSEFLSFKSAVQPHKVSASQFAIARYLNEIEERVSLYPLITPKEAVVLMGEVDCKNPSRTINNEKKRYGLFVFYFGESNKARVPSFQFNLDTLGVYSCVPKLAKILSNINDWGVYAWLTTFDTDLQCTPAEAMAKPELHGTLLYLAGLFKSESTLRELNYVAEHKESQ